MHIVKEDIPIALSLLLITYALCAIVYAIGVFHGT